MAEPSYRTVEENDEADPNKIATSAWARLPRGRAVRRGCPAASTCRPLARRTRGLLMLARSLKAATSEGAIATLRQGLRCGRRPRRPWPPQGHRQNHEDHRHRAPAEEAAAGRRSATGRCTLPPARQSPAAAGQDNPRWRTQFKGRSAYGSGPKSASPAGRNGPLGNGINEATPQLRRPRAAEAYDSNEEFLNWTDPAPTAHPTSAGSFPRCSRPVRAFLT